MASALTGTIAVIKVSGITLSGSGGELGEASVTFGKDHGKFDPVGTDVSLHTTGMKKAEGSMTKRWVSETNEVTAGSSAIFQALVDSDDEFSVEINPTGGGRVVISGCIAGDRSTRIAPGTEIVNETLTFTGLDWGQTN